MVEFGAQRFHGERTNLVSRDPSFKAPAAHFVAHATHRRYPSLMSIYLDVERLALDLPERERATLAANLLDSLPGILSDTDEGVAEAIRRDAEIEADPAQTISLAELDSHTRGRRG